MPFVSFRAQNSNPDNTDHSQISCYHLTNSSEMSVCNHCYDNSVPLRDQDCLSFHMVVLKVKDCKSVANSFESDKKILGGFFSNGDKHWS